uniref:Uncharacterized protein n=1 Tax=Leptocylindrus danicus TaxID=163516 RepID=A0A7S2P697_9STRA|mmetsp:Transcript_23411/g.35126  ORF Transcript_23411/g.35126 Transcript_23411/m.35126 type:complete len:351 (+) Transcript_23411:509-1561(+)
MVFFSAKTHEMPLRPTLTQLKPKVNRVMTFSSESDFSTHNDENPFSSEDPISKIAAKDSMAATTISLPGEADNFDATLLDDCFIETSKIAGGVGNIFSDIKLDNDALIQQMHSSREENWNNLNTGIDEKQLLKAKLADAESYIQESQVWSSNTYNTVLELQQENVSFLQNYQAAQSNLSQCQRENENLHRCLLVAENNLSNLQHQNYMVCQHMTALNCEVFSLEKKLVTLKEENVRLKNINESLQVDQNQVTGKQSTRSKSRHLMDVADEVGGFSDLVQEVKHLRDEVKILREEKKELLDEIDELEGLNGELEYKHSENRMELCAALFKIQRLSIADETAISSVAAVSHT